METLRVLLVASFYVLFFGVPVIIELAIGVSSIVKAIRSRQVEALLLRSLKQNGYSEHARPIHPTHQYIYQPPKANSGNSPGNALYRNLLRPHTGQH